MRVKLPGNPCRQITRRIFHLCFEIRYLAFMYGNSTCKIQSIIVLEVFSHMIYGFKALVNVFCFPATLRHCLT